MSGLNSFLDGLEKENKANEEPTGSSKVEPELQAKDDKQEVKEETSPSEGEKTKEPKEENMIPLKAQIEERHKRQEAERQRDEERRRREQLEQELNQASQAKEERKDFYDDPEGRLNQFGAEMQQQLLIQKIQMSEYTVKQQHSDYEDKLQRFLEEAKSNPSLTHQMKVHPHPAQFAYDTADQMVKMDEFKDLDTYKQSLSDKIRKEIEAEVRAKYESKNSKASALPDDSLSQSNSAPTEVKDKSVDVEGFIKNQAWKRRAS